MRKLPRVLKKREILPLISALRHPNPRSKFTQLRNTIMGEFLLRSGLRISEAIHLMIKDIDLDESTILVKQGKGSKDRWVILVANAEWKEKFRRFIAEREGLVFPALHGDNLSRSYVVQVFQAACIRSGITGVHPHTMRHTHATELYDQTEKLELVQDQLGHSKLDTTRIYAHIGTEKRKLMLKGVVL